MEFTSITNHVHNWILFLLWLHLFILSGVISSLISSSMLGTLHSREFIFQCPSYLFAFSYCLWGSQSKNTEVVCHFLLQWTMFRHNSPSWPIHLGWPYTAWLIVSLSYTRLWSMWSDWLVFCNYGFQSVCPLMEKDRQLILLMLEMLEEPSWC